MVDCSYHALTFRDFHCLTPMVFLSLSVPQLKGGIEHLSPCRQRFRGQSQCSQPCALLMVPTSLLGAPAHDEALDSIFVTLPPGLVSAWVEYLFPNDHQNVIGILRDTRAPSCCIRYNEDKQVISLSVTFAKKKILNWSWSAGSLHKTIPSLVQSYHRPSIGCQHTCSHLKIPITRSLSSFFSLRLEKRGITNPSLLLSPRRSLKQSTDDNKGMGLLFTIDIIFLSVTHQY